MQELSKIDRTKCELPKWQKHDLYVKFNPDVESKIHVRNDPPAGS